MLAIISDIHANIEALTAVLADIRQRGVERIICLGDIVGYGPDPRDCLELVRQNATTTLLGNHDFAVLYEPENFNVGAEAAAFWTREQLEIEKDTDLRSKWWEFLGSLQMKYVLRDEELTPWDMTFVHGSPRRPVNEYVFPDDVYNNVHKLQGLFDRFDHLCFVGHTHVPGVFVETPDFYTPEELEFVYEIDSNRKALVNVGSVGQPRDRDNRASYVVVEPGLLRFVRVAYDYEAVISKVLPVPELDDYLGIRLREGR